MSSTISRAITIYRQHGFRQLLSAGRDWLKSHSTNVIRTVVYGLPIVDHFYFRISRDRLSTLMKKESSFEDAVDTAYNYRGYGNYRSIEPMQGVGPLTELFEQVEQINPQTLVEIGTARGGTFYLMTRYFQDSVRVISVNLPYSFGYKYKIKLLEQIDQNKDLRFIVGDSHSQSTHDKVEEATNGSIDFLFIDGDHSYEGVKADFRRYESLVPKGGIIAFHDIQHEHERVGVVRLWNELKEEYETEEIDVSPDKTTGGIGILYK